MPPATVGKAFVCLQETDGPAYPQLRVGQWAQEH